MWNKPRNEGLKMKLDRQQVTLRLPLALAEYVQTKAEGIGVSTNALIMMLIDMGLKLYESDIIQQVEAPNQ